jgi:hypothetical protein
MSKSVHPLCFVEGNDQMAAELRQGLGSPSWPFPRELCQRERERERLVAAVRIGGARFIFIRLLNDHHLARHCAAHARMRRILACATQRVPISLSDIDSCSRSLTADRDSHAREIIPPFIEIMIPLDCRARRETGRLLRQALDR